VNTRHGETSLGTTPLYTCSTWWSRRGTTTSNSFSFPCFST